MTLPTPLRAAAARVTLREDLERAAANPGEVTPIRNTIGASPNARYVRAHEYRRGQFSYGLSIPPEYVENAYWSAEDGAVCVILRPDAPIPAPSITDERSAALLHAYETGEAVWPGGTEDRARESRNARLKGTDLHIYADGIIRRSTTPKEH